jgi:SpoIID/LytB domain protein
MSQYGAQGAAVKGLNAQQILAFYYPGTQRTIVEDGIIRVLITGDTDPVTVAPRSGLRVRDLGTGGATYTLPTTATYKRWRLVASTAATDRVEWYDGTAWKVYKPGGRSALVGTGEFSSPDGPLTLFADSGQKVYRGAMRSARPTTTTTARDTVNVLGLDDYVKGVIPSEMPASWNKYAVRSQAVAARTYAMFDREAHPTRYYDTCDTTSCQVYRGVSVEDPRSNAAADWTAGQIRTYEGKPAFTQFSSSNGGWTSAGSKPYLAHKQDPYEAASNNPKANWSISLSAAKIRAAYPAIGKLLRVRVTQREGGGDWQGRVERIVLEGASAKRTLTGDQFRSSFGLYSTWFRL